MEAGPSAKEEHEPPAKAAEEAAEEAAEVAGVVRGNDPLARHEAAMTPRSATSYLRHLRHLRAAPHASVHPWEDR